MADQPPWVLVDAAGTEYRFENRGEYLATLYSGGYTAKPADAPERARAPRPRAGVAPPPETPRREPVNDEPVTETAPNE